MIEKKKPKINKKKLIFVGIILALILAFFSVIFAIINIFNDKVIKGVYIDNIYVSGYKEKEIVDKFNKLIDDSKEKQLILKYGDLESKFTPESLNVEYNVENTANEAYQYGRNDNIFVNNFKIIKAMIKKQNINLKKTINDEKMDEIINGLNEKIPGIVQNYAYCVEGENLIITKGKSGIKIDKDQLKTRLEAAISNYENNSSIIDIPTMESKPDDIDLEKIHSEIYKEKQDAYITKDPVTVHPNINGIDFAITMDEAKELLKEDKEEYLITIKITVANITMSDLGKEAFPNQLGTYNTKYDVRNSNRVNNVELATKKINGTIILPGETFSYNQTVGKRTIESGFKEAGAYAGGKIVQEVGGGICQVSSTLYNAVLYANLEVKERYNHYFESSYVDAGRDATVSWGTVDFKFKNNKKYPIKISAVAKNGVETVSIYGIKEDEEYEVIIQSKKISIISREVRYEDDNTIETGRELISQSGHDGCISETYKILKKGNQIISNKLITRDTYHSLEKIVKRGTKVESIEENETQNENNSDNNKNEEYENINTLQVNEEILANN